MRIGIDISQIAHEGTGVATYVREMVKALLGQDKKNEYVLFGASLRKLHVFFEYFQTVNTLSKKIRLVVVPFPPTLLEIIWNRLHVLPIEWFVGNIDVFWSSDWAQPPLTSAKGITTIHDLIAVRFPRETDRRIVAAHTRRLAHVAKECQAILCDSQATKKDTATLLNVPTDRLHVVYPGVNV